MELKWRMGYGTFSRSIVRRLVRRSRAVAGRGCGVQRGFSFFFLKKIVVIAVNCMLMGLIFRVEKVDNSGEEGNNAKFMNRKENVIRNTGRGIDVS